MTSVKMFEDMVPGGEVTCYDFFGDDMNYECETQERYA